MPLYFAYGSNLLSHRLIARCPSARAMGPGRLRQRRLTFSKYSFIDGSGKATLQPGSEDAHGVLYRLTTADLAVLDRIEGVGKGYDRLTVEIESDRQTLAAETYLATAPVDGQAPFDWYLALILAGMLEHGLPATALQHLLRTNPVADPDPERPGNLAAREALAAGGWPDLQGILRQHGINAC